MIFFLTWPNCLVKTESSKRDRCKFLVNPIIFCLTADLQNFSPITVKKITEIFFVWNSRWGRDTKFEIVIPRLWLVLRENDSERKLNSKLNYLENPYNYQIWWIWDQGHLCDILSQQYFWAISKVFIFKRFFNWLFIHNYEKWFYLFSGSVNLRPMLSSREKLWWIWQKCVKIRYGTKCETFGGRRIVLPWP